MHEMLRVMQAVEAVPLPSHPAVGSAQICLTDIVSEPFPGHSVVPNRCRVSYDRRLVPGETPESVLAAMQSLPAFKRHSIFGDNFGWGRKVLHRRKPSKD